MRHNPEGRIDENYPWSRLFKRFDDRSQKIVYLVGDSWLPNFYCQRIFVNQYKDCMLINASVGGNSNALIINTLKKDIEMLKTFKQEVYIVVCFSEVGRSLIELRSVSPKNYSSTHYYLAEILKKQYKEVNDIASGFKKYITTAFIDNNFNNNKSILDFCIAGKKSRPKDVFTIFSNNLYEYLKKVDSQTVTTMLGSPDRRNIFNFDLISDIDKSIAMKDYMESCPEIDETLHPFVHLPYEKFFEHVFEVLDNDIQI